MLRLFINPDLIKKTTYKPTDNFFKFSIKIELINVSYFFILFWQRVSFEMKRSSTDGCFNSDHFNTISKVIWIKFFAMYIPYHAFKLWVVFCWVTFVLLNKKKVNRVPFLTDSFYMYIQIVSNMIKKNMKFDFKKLWN